VGFWAKNAVGHFKKVKKKKKKRQKVSESKEKRKKRRKIEKNDAKKRAICDVFSKLGIFLVLWTPDGVTREFRAGGSWWMVDEMLKWAVWVKWKR